MATLGGLSRFTDAGRQRPYLTGGRLFNPTSGRPLYSGPAGEPGYGGGQGPFSSYWQMPDGTDAWWFQTTTPDPGNQTALAILPALPGVPPLDWDYAFNAVKATGATDDQAHTAVAIMTAETGRLWSFHGQEGPGVDRIGLFGIELMVHPEYVGQNLYNITNNVAAAWAASNGWANFAIWGTYTNGAYVQYLPGQPKGPPKGSIIPPVLKAAGGNIEAIVDSVVDAAAGVLNFVLGPVAGFAKRVLHDLFGPLDTITSALYKGVLDAFNWTESRFVDATHFAEGLFTDARNGIADIVHFAIGVVDAAWRAAVSVVDASWRFAVGVVDGAWRDGVAAVDAAWRFSVGVVDAAWRDAVGLVDVAWRDAVNVVDTAWRDGVSIVQGAFDGFVRDVFDPLKTLADHWFNDVLNGAETVIADVKKVEKWIAKLAELSFDDVTTWGQDLVSISPANVGQWVADTRSVLADQVLPHVSTLGR